MQRDSFWCNVVVAPFPYSAVPFLSAAIQKLRTHASAIKECAPATEEYPKNMAFKRKKSLRLKLTGLLRALDNLEGASALKSCVID